MTICRRNHYDSRDTIFCHIVIISLRFFRGYRWVVNRVQREFTVTVNAKICNVCTVQICMVGQSAPSTRHTFGNLLAFSYARFNDDGRQHVCRPLCAHTFRVTRHLAKMCLPRVSGRQQWPDYFHCCANKKYNVVSFELTEMCDFGSWSTYTHDAGDKEWDGATSKRMFPLRIRKEAVYCFCCFQSKLQISISWHFTLLGKYDFTVSNRVNLASNWTKTTLNYSRPSAKANTHTQAFFHAQK